MTAAPPPCSQNTSGSPAIGWRGRPCRSIGRRTRHSGRATHRSRAARLPAPPKRTASRERAIITFARSRLPVRLEADYLFQRLVEVSLKTDRAIVDEHMCRRLAPRDRGDEVIELVLPQPASHAGWMTRCEDDDIEAVGVERLEKRSRTRPRRIPV